VTAPTVIATTVDTARASKVAIVEGEEGFGDMARSVVDMPPRAETERPAKAAATPESLSAAVKGAELSVVDMPPRVVTVRRSNSATMSSGEGWTPSVSAAASTLIGIEALVDVGVCAWWSVWVLVECDAIDAAKSEVTVDISAAPQVIGVVGAESMAIDVKNRGDPEEIMV
jgi:hypothetical protein